MTARTDLHTHFAGILSADELVGLGLEHGVKLDPATAKRLDIVNASYSGPHLALSALDEGQMGKLKAGLELDPQKKSLFDSLDEVYANRAFITKNAEMFVPLLEKIAQSYKQQGVEYAELSYAGVISNPALIRDLHENMPRIEQETGVKLRFLGAMWRHSDPEWNMDEVDRLKSVLQSPYIVGIDVMGHEKNPIRDLKEPLNDIIGYAAQNIPGCAVRLHAGENPYYSADPSALDDYSFNNAYESVQISDSARRDADGNFLGPYGEDIQIRVGHGRYGLHPMTLELEQKAGAISELCLSSNLLLNHADSYKGPFNLYAERDIGFVLGSDGYGMYNTSLPGEFELAVKAGMTPAAQMLLDDTEEAVIIKDAQRFHAKMEKWKQYEQECAAKGVDAFDALAEAPFSTPDGKPRWTDGVSALRHAETAALHDALTAALSETGVNVDEHEIDDLLKNRRVTLFSGASKSSWKNVPEDQQQAVVENMKAYVEHLDGRRDAVVTGGTDFGFEAVIHKLVEERNKTLPEDRRIPVIGALTLEANTKDIRHGTLSHAKVLRYGDDFARSWMDQSPALMDMVMRTDTRVVMAGGGQVIRDMVVDASGRGLFDANKIFLFAGINGASGEKAREFPNARFETTGELLQRMAGTAQQVVKPASGAQGPQKAATPGN
ncbi:MAG: hypothetical protein GC185_13095 [Alphaproteobacteria bacterium]|nr:hypothetical protein [Alphaproteobacteria bacterium]